MSVIAIKVSSGSLKKAKRIGRGSGNGRGRYCGRGQKGQNARTGGGVRVGFEGGQMPLYRRIPKRGFKNRNRIEYNVINVGSLSGFEEGTEINLDLLGQKGLIKHNGQPVKLLANGTLKVKSLKISVNAVSEAARKKIEKLNGSVTIIEK